MLVLLRHPIFYSIIIIVLHNDLFTYLAFAIRKLEWFLLGLRLLFQKGSQAAKMHIHQYHPNLELDVRTYMQTQLQIITCTCIPWFSRIFFNDSPANDSGYFSIPGTSFVQFNTAFLNVSCCVLLRQNQFHFKFHLDNQIKMVHALGC